MFIRKVGKGQVAKSGRTQKEIDKELRRQYDKGRAYDEDEDDLADRRGRLAKDREDDKFEALLRDYNNQAKSKKRRAANHVEEHQAYEQRIASGSAQ